MPVGKLLGRPPKRPSRWRAMTRWRDWNLTVKLAAVTLVPILIALVLGVTTIGSQVERSASYQRMDRLVALGAEIRLLLGALQSERAVSAAQLVQTTVEGSPELAAARAGVDGALPAMTAAAERATTLDPSMVSPGREAADQVARISEIREGVDEGRLDPSQAINEYTTVATGLLKLDTALTAGIRDDSIGGTPSALHDLQIAKEEVSLAFALVDYGIARGTLAPSELNQLRTTEVRLTDRLADFRASATQTQRQDFDSTVEGPSFETRSGLVGAALGDQGRSPESALREASAQQWADTSAAVTDRLTEVSERLGTQVREVSAGLADQSSTRAGLFTVILFAALVLAAAVVFLITRQLLRSLRLLRAGALDIAEVQLPGAVQNIQDGRPQSIEVQPVPVTSGDEIGEVARAFDAVHSQALRLAVEQAAMRTGYGSVFVNLSRRSQSLVQRQLQLIERLERDEEDADQLATLFQLDHLATRMRRNNENLMVLSGAEPARRSGQPVSTTDVLRAAVSEIEQYQRVVVQPPPPARVVGYAASDLMRLVAELLDNATAFSAPETQVTVATRIAEDRTLSIDILDKGIGMNEAEVAEANARLTEAGSIDLATSRRMGLFVVGRLAGRHGIGVLLHGGRDIVGVRATVTVPGELVMEAVPGKDTRTKLEPATLAETTAAGTRPAAAFSTVPVEVPPATGALPRRRPNGASRSGALPVPGPSLGSALERRLGGEEVPAQGTVPATGEISGTALFSPVQPVEPGELTEAEAVNAAEATGTIPVVPAQAVGENAAVNVPPVAESAVEADTPAEAVEVVAEAPLKRTQVPPETDVEATLPSGKALFLSPHEAAKQAAASSEVLSDWWNASETPEVAAEPEPAWPENTPIFDAMVSAWFRKSEPVKTEAAEAETPAAAEVAEVAEDTVTAEKQPEPAEAAEVAETVEAVEPVEAAEEAEAAETTETAETAEVAAKAEPVEEPAEIAETVKTGEWEFPSDESFRTVQALSQAEPSSFTAAGLPRRRRGEKLMPGSAAAATPVPTAKGTDLPVRDPANVRGRLNSFQQGINRGRQAVGSDPAAGPAPAPEKPSERAVKPSPAPRLPLPVRPRADLGPSPAPEGTGTAGAEKKDEWTFTTDDRWQTVQAVTQAEPASFTASGLPRRKRGEHLLPGSAAPATATPAPRPDRDPHDVRGRLSSFQQGVRRGRHRNSQAADGKNQKVEGE